MSATTNAAGSLVALLLLRPVLLVLGLVLLLSGSATAQQNNTMTNNSTTVDPAVPPTTNTTTNTTTIADVVAAADNLMMLDALLELTGLTEVIRNLEVTVFAPTDAALQALNCRFSEDADFRPHLTAILLYHVIDGIFLSGELVVGEEIPTLNGETLTITSVNPNVVINNNTNTGSTVVSADNVAANGVAHLIDRVLLPTAATSSIADLVTTNPTLSILTQAVVAADLAPVLADFDNVYTVFAPSNAAFEKLPVGILEALLLPDNGDALVDVLLFHVLEDAVFAFADLVVGGVFGELTVSSASNATTINNSSVIVGTNRLANNGIVHIIDTVLLPPSINLTALLGSGSNSKTVTPTAAPIDAPIETPIGTPSLSPIGPPDGAGSGNETMTDDEDDDDDNSNLLVECEFDCDFDADCAPGLLCADEHKEELTNQGLDPRKAYCVGALPGPGFSEDSRSTGEVCYDPALA